MKMVNKLIIIKILTIKTLGACAAIVDKNPVAPLHIVIFPKDRSSGMSRLSNVDQRHVEILGHLIYIATGLARQFG